MKAALVRGKNRLTLEDIPIPDVIAGSMLIRVKACAICGSDVRIFRRGDSRARYPVVIGHEIAGVIERVDRNVTGFAEGDRVCVAPGMGCGECVYCRNGHSNVCIHPCPPIGYASHGGFAEYVVPPENVVRLGFVNRIANELSFDQASMSELLACCLNAQENAPVQAGDVVLIMGAGPAGCMHIQLSQLKGAKKVIVTQRSRGRLEMAKRFAPDRIVASSEEDLGKAVMEETDGLGADVIFVCAPSKDAQEQALKLLAPRGRVNLFGGLPKDQCRITGDANMIHYGEYFVSGASSSLARQNREALDLLVSGKVSAAKYITHRFRLSEIVKAFETAESRAGIKVVVNP